MPIDYTFRHVSAVLDRSNPSADSVYRERLFEHQLIWEELMRYAWMHDFAGLEVSQPAMDRSGHDLVLEECGITRQVQLKTSWVNGKASRPNVHLGLVGKPSACVVWMLVDETDMTCQSFLFFGGALGAPLPPNLRTVPRTRFRPMADIARLYTSLFDCPFKLG